MTFELISSNDFNNVEINNIEFASANSMGGMRLENSNVVFESIKSFDVYLPKLEDRYGKNLGNFLFDYTKRFFNELNTKALYFLCERSSCWRYQEIGSNWKSKRFLCDINFILERAGFPRFTHIDKRIQPTKTVRSLSNVIPKAEKTEKRLIIEFNPILDNLKDFPKTQRTQLKKDNMAKLKLKGRKKGVFLKAKLVKKFIEENHVIKTSTNDICKLGITQCQDYKPISNDYLVALKKTPDPIIIKSLSEKIYTNTLNSFIYKEIENVKMLKTKVDVILKDKKLKHQGKIYKIKDDESEVKIKNYYEVLEDYVNENEIESKTVLLDEEELISLYNLVKIANPESSANKCLHYLKSLLSHKGMSRFILNNIRLLFVKRKMLHITVDAILNRIVNECLVVDCKAGLSPLVKILNRFFQKTVRRINRKNRKKTVPIGIKRSKPDTFEPVDRLNKKPNLSRKIRLIDFDSIIKINDLKKRERDLIIEQARVKAETEERKRIEDENFQREQSLKKKILSEKVKNFNRIEFKKKMKSILLSVKEEEGMEDYFKEGCYWLDTNDKPINESEITISKMLIEEYPFIYNDYIFIEQEKFARTEKFFKNKFYSKFIRLNNNLFYSINQ